MLGRTVSFRVFAVSVAAVVSCVFFVLLFLYFVANTGSVVATGSDAGGASVGVASAGEVEQAVSQMVSTTVVETTSVVSTTVEQSTTTAESEKSSAKNEIIFIGDSLLAQKDTPPVLIAKLVADGWQQLSINAQGGRKNYLGSTENIDFVSMLKEVENNSYDAFTSSGSPAGVHQNALKQLYPNDQSTLSKISDNDLNAAFRQADAVVVSLGTNDKSDASTMEDGIRLTAASIKKINPTIEIYWVKMCAQGGMHAKGNVFNPILEDLKQELDLELIDWASQCQASHQYDGVHYNEQGVEAFTDVLVNAIR